MADNADLTLGDGTLIAAADDIGGVKYPRVKVTFGVDGIATDVSDGDPLPITGAVDIQSPAITNNANPEVDQAIAIGFNDGGASEFKVVSNANPLPVTGTISATNPSVEVIGDPAPLSATVIGFDDGGDTAAVSAISPLPVDATGSAVSIAGTVTVGSHAVTNAGTFAVQAAQSGAWNITNVSGTVTLPTGASTAAKQPALGTAGTASADVISVQGIASMTPLLATVTGNLTNISGTISLPTGAATAAKQPALGTAGTASADVITMQGIASMTPILATVTGNLTNISGTITLPTGAATAVKQPALGTAGTASTDVISVQGIASMTPLLATVTGNLTNISGTITLPTGASTAAKQPALGTAGTASADVISVQGIASMTALKTDPSAVTSPVKGGTASGSAVANAPVTVGGRASTALPTAVADGQVVDAMRDKFGRAVAVGAIRENKFDTNTSLSNTTSETTIIAAESATYHDVYGLVLANTGAAGTEVSIRDDTGGTVRMTFYVPAGDTRGFMLPAGDGKAQTATNKNWTAQCATATTALKITALYIKNV